MCASICAAHFSSPYIIVHSSRGLRVSGHAQQMRFGFVSPLAGGHDAASGGSTVVLVCEKHAVAPTRYSCRAEFGLVRADKLEAPPEE